MSGGTEIWWNEHTNMKTSWIKLLPFLGILLLTSCITFDHQTMDFQYDREKDRLLILQVYEGIHGESGSADLTETEKGQLDTVMKTEATFFFSNWPFEYRRDTVEKLINDPTAT